MIDELIQEVYRYMLSGDPFGKEWHAAIKKQYMDKLMGLPITEDRWDHELFFFEDRRAIEFVERYKNGSTPYSRWRKGEEE